MNLSKATRKCKNLQRYMREVKTATVIDVFGRKRGGQSQLHYYCEHGMTASVVRMLAMRSIDVEARRGGREDGETCLLTATYNGHLDICRLLIEKGAQLEAKDAQTSNRNQLDLEQVLTRARNVVNLHVANKYSKKGTVGTGSGR